MENVLTGLWDEEMPGEGVPMMLVFVETCDLERVLDCEVVKVATSARDNEVVMTWLLVEVLAAEVDALACTVADWLQLGEAVPIVEMLTPVVRVFDCDCELCVGEVV